MDFRHASRGGARIVTGSGVSLGLLGAGLLAVAGCGESQRIEGRADLYPVNGRVTYRGAPVPGASVVFHRQGGAADAAPQSAFGQTDENGNFNLTTYSNADGAPAGEYIVTVTKRETAEPSPAADPEEYVPPEAAGAAVPQRPASLIPEKYESPATSDLRATVSADGTNEPAFELVD